MKRILFALALLVGLAGTGLAQTNSSLDYSTNFAYGNVSTGYDTSATSIVLTAGFVSSFPDPATYGAYDVVWYNASTYKAAHLDPNKEIVRVTATSGDTLAIIRAQQNTSKANHNTNGKIYRIEYNWTAGMANAIRDSVRYAITLASNPTATDSLFQSAGIDTLRSQDGAGDDYLIIQDHLALGVGGYGTVFYGPIQMTSYVLGDWVPSTSYTYDLGALFLPWQEIWGNTVFADTLASVSDIEIYVPDRMRTNQLMMFDMNAWFKRQSSNPSPSLATGYGIVFASSSDSLLYYMAPDSSVYLISPDTSATGITTFNTLTSAIQTLATGTTGTDVSWSSTGSTHTLNIPDASLTARGLITTGLQGITGFKYIQDSLQVGALTANAGVLRITTDASGFHRIYSGANGVERTLRLPDSSGTIALLEYLPALGGGSGGGIDSLNHLGDTLHVFATGTSGSDFNISSSSAGGVGTHTFNIPDAGASARGLVTTGTQTFGGAKTFDSVAVLQSGTSTLWIGATGAADNGRIIITGNDDAFGYPGTMQAPTLTSAQTWTFPDSSGTIALREYTATAGHTQAASTITTGTFGAGTFTFPDRTVVQDSLDLGIAGSQVGTARFYGGTSYATRVRPGSPASEITLTLPATSGTLALAGATLDSSYAMIQLDTLRAWSLQSMYVADGIHFIGDTVTIRPSTVFQIGLNNDPTPIRLWDASAASGYYGTISTATLSGTNKTWSFPNSSGTIALTSDITAVDSSFQSIGVDTIYAVNQSAKKVYIGDTLVITNVTGNAVAVTSTAGYVPYDSAGAAYANSPISISSTDVTMENVGSLRIPIGTTAQRPSGTSGKMRYNSDTDSVEIYIGGRWTNCTNLREQTLAFGNEDSTITTGTAKITWRMPFKARVVRVRASLKTASSSGTPTFDINEGGTTILSTKLTIDANEKTSTTAAAAAVISDYDIADDAEMTIDIDTAGTGAVGPKITIYYYPVP